MAMSERNRSSPNSASPFILPTTEEKRRIELDLRRNLQSSSVYFKGSDSVPLYVGAIAVRVVQSTSRVLNLHHPTLEEETKKEKCVLPGTSMASSEVVGIFLF
mmetsp:Transcript_14444/g.25065  ORF Transcript_14444/g.25065 Transcript_14444/m.25065 type:complete len:103 (-) Transcript_14444:1186-1494(-)